MARVPAEMTSLIAVAYFVVLCPAVYGSSPSMRAVAQADLSVTVNAPATVAAGADIVYDITIANAGPSDATNATLTDVSAFAFLTLTQTSGPTATCTAGQIMTLCTIGSFAAGTSATFTGTGHVPSNTPGGSVFGNTATVSWLGTDPNGSNNVVFTTTVVSGNADLSVTKSGPATTLTNTTMTYTVTVANAGPAVANGVTLTETIPAGMTFNLIHQLTGTPFGCTTTNPISCIGSLPLFPGDSATFEFTFNVPAVPPGTSFSDTVTVSSTTPDSNTANNTASATTTAGTSVPALSTMALLMLALALAIVAFIRMR
jgi:uncharacterized repeat protein (TIGR01451 family)